MPTKRSQFSAVFGYDNAPDGWPRIPNFLVSWVLRHDRSSGGAKEGRKGGRNRWAEKLKDRTWVYDDDGDDRNLQINGRCIYSYNDGATPSQRYCLLTTGNLGGLLTYHTSGPNLGGVVCVHLVKCLSLFHCFTFSDGMVSGYARCNSNNDNIPRD